ncbi:NADPH-dependent FMN reductase [Paraburkholderia fungorum]|uniref:NADPH-dependent FMN reductase n=1 Tax=Paraburkholderia fungorum TaxID=134537 RepID=UPI001C1EACDD|nr:NAD(P)H-dependent oxidoreductase [Paraburkholderia fungorum]MBU7443502.1 NAD(P)H-dependent oxidoreductase [Paraburkholderia fungorum]
MERRPLILGIGGTTRAGSSSERALAISLHAAEKAGADTIMLAGPALELPMYAPERPERTEAAQTLVNAYRDCDGIIVSSASYHGVLSGLLKNALDYTQDLAQDERVYFDGCAMGLISCGGGWQGAGTALSTLRSIAHTLRAWPTPFGATLNTSLPLFGADGECIDDSVQAQLEMVARQVVKFARMRQAVTIGM